MIAAPVSCRQTVSSIGALFMASRTARSGFAGNAIDPLDPLRDELVDENLSP